MIKQQLRSKFIEIRKNLGSLYQIQASDDICRNLAKIVRLQAKNKIIAIYYPINNEVDVLPVITLLAECRFALPKIIGDEMEFRIWQPTAKLIKGKFCFEPEDSALSAVPDVIVTPLLAFDRRCNRLGYGKGHYDKTTTKAPYNSAYRIGVAYSLQECCDDTTFHENHDVPLNAVVTENEVIYAK